MYVCACVREGKEGETKREREREKRIRVSLSLSLSLSLSESFAVAAGTADLEAGSVLPGNSPLSKSLYFSPGRPVSFPPGFGLHCDGGRPGPRTSVRMEARMKAGE
jgi:hypothetical protein